METSAAAMAMEQGEYVRAVLAEVTDGSLNIRNLRFHAGQWKQANALEPRTLFDAIGNANVPADRRVALDVAAMKESMNDEELHHCSRPSAAG